MLVSRCHPVSFEVRLRDIGSEQNGADYADRPDRFAKASRIAPSAHQVAYTSIEGAGRGAVTARQTVRESDSQDYSYDCLPVRLLCCLSECLTV